MSDKDDFVLTVEDKGGGGGYASEEDEEGPDQEESHDALAEDLGVVLDNREVIDEFVELPELEEEKRVKNNYDNLDNVVEREVSS